MAKYKVTLTDDERDSLRKCLPLWGRVAASLKRAAATD